MCKATNFDNYKSFSVDSNIRIVERNTVQVVFDSKVGEILSRFFFVFFLEKVKRINHLEVFLAIKPLVNVLKIYNTTPDVFFISCEKYL